MKYFIPFALVCLLGSFQIVAQQEDLYITTDWYVNDTLHVSGDLNVSGGSKVLVKPGGVIDVEFDLNLAASADTLTLEASSTNYAKLKFDGSFLGSGIVEQQQYFASEGWHMVGSSMDIATAAFFAPTDAADGGVGSNAFGGTSSTVNFYSWNGQNFVNVANNSVTASEGVGYFGWVGQYGFRENTGVQSFYGLPNTSVIMPSLYDNTVTSDAVVLIEDSASFNNQARKGWNLVSNPFTCPLDFNLIASSDLLGSFYVYNAVNSDGARYEISSVAGLDYHIAPLQSFWVKASGASPSLGTLTMASHGTIKENPSFFKTVIDFDRLVLRVHDANDSTHSDYTVVSFIDNTEDGFDDDWDAYKLPNSGVFPNLYSYHQGMGMGVNAIDYGPGNSNPKTVQIAFRSENHGQQYDIAYDDSYMINNYFVYLEDLKTGSMHDLTSGSYSFNHDTSFVYRFVLHLQNNNFSTFDAPQPSTGIDVWTFANKVYLLSTYDVDVNIELHNLNGQLVFADKASLLVNEKQVVTLPESVSKGIYSLMVSDQVQTHAVKVIIP